MIEEREALPKEEGSVGVAGSVGVSLTLTPLLSLEELLSLTLDSYVSLEDLFSLTLHKNVLKNKSN